MNPIKKWNEFVAEQDELYKTAPDAVKDRIFWMCFKAGMAVLAVLLSVAAFEVASRESDDLAKHISTTTTLVPHAIPNEKGPAK